VPGQQFNVGQDAFVADKADFGIGEDVDFAGGLEADDFIHYQLEQRHIFVRRRGFNVKRFFVNDQFIVFCKRHQNGANQGRYVLLV